MKPPEDTATIERDLHAVDAALAGGAARHDDPVARELQELALALRADAPVPEPAFAQDLRERAQAGFPGEHKKRRLPRLKLAPVAAVLAPSMLVVVLVFAAGGPSPGGGGDSDSGSGGAGGRGPERGRRLRRTRRGRTDAPAASATDSLSQPPPSGHGLCARPARAQDRALHLDDADGPRRRDPRAADDVNRVTARHGGFVLRSELDTGDGGSTGSFELRIPSGRLQGALRDLAQIATVGSQSQTGQDVTRDYVTATDRLQAARAERRSLLRRLEEADTDAEAEALRARLDLVAGEINGLRGQLRDLRLRTEYAIVSLDLIGDEDGNSGSGCGGRSTTPSATPATCSSASPAC